MQQQQRPQRPQQHQQQQQRKLRQQRPQAPGQQRPRAPQPPPRPQQRRLKTLAASRGGFGFRSVSMRVPWLRCLSRVFYCSTRARKTNVGEDMTPMNTRVRVSPTMMIEVMMAVSLIMTAHATNRTDHMEAISKTRTDRLLLTELPPMVAVTDATECFLHPLRAIVTRSYWSLKDGVELSTEGLVFNDLHYTSLRCEAVG
mmetsp:Transcript_9498/g.26564  ORF Transcript_9498/g.26564 Transcript_9498/m.26564 type:complete len:200 (-) Transcript_9498:57-656(-)